MSKEYLIMELLLSFLPTLKTSQYTKFPLSCNTSAEKRNVIRFSLISSLAMREEEIKRFFGHNFQQLTKLWSHLITLIISRWEFLFVVNVSSTFNIYIDIERSETWRGWKPHKMEIDSQTGNLWVEFKLHAIMIHIKTRRKRRDV